MTRATAETDLFRLAPLRETTEENHHLWNNRGIWWMHVTVISRTLKKRARFSLKTRDIVKARAKRDRILVSLAGKEFAI